MSKYISVMERIRDLEKRITRLQREKKLLRAALQETINQLCVATMYTERYVDTSWQERILRKTKEQKTEA